MTALQVAQLPALSIALSSLSKSGVPYTVYDNVRIEPSDKSILDAIAFAKKGNFE
jgi:hydroxyacid-oxoacid transhydrogenase